MIIFFESHLFAVQDEIALILCWDPPVSAEKKEEVEAEVVVVEKEDENVKETPYRTNRRRTRMYQMMLLDCCCCCGRRHYSLLSCCCCCWFRLLRENNSTADIFVFSDFPSLARIRFSSYSYSHIHSMTETTNRRTIHPLGISLIKRFECTLGIGLTTLCILFVVNQLSLSIKLGLSLSIFAYSTL